MESWDKGAGLWEDKTGHSGMNVHSEGIMHAGKQNKEKTYTVVDCIYIENPLHEFHI